MGSGQLACQPGRVLGWPAPGTKQRETHIHGQGERSHADKQQGGEKYQQAFYVFEELAQAPATSSTISLVSQAVVELHLGRTEEAQAALDQALEKDGSNAEAIANLLVLTVIAGQDPTELTT